MSRLSLRVLAGELAIWKLPADAPVPELPAGALVSLTRTARELSVVSPPESVPPGAAVERAWRCLEVAGPLSLELTGVLASLCGPLAEAGVSLFTISTFDTDYLLVREPDLERACSALESAGHRVIA